MGGFTYHPPSTSHDEHAHGRLDSHDGRLSVLERHLEEQLQAEKDVRAEVFAHFDVRVGALERITQRRFWGRLKWLLFGK